MCAGWMRSLPASSAIVRASFSTRWYARALRFIARPQPLHGRAEELAAGLVHRAVERTHLTMRRFSGRLVRQTLGFSKDLTCYRASAAWEDAIYNLVRPLKTLRQAVADQPGRHWQPHTPAMAAGRTDHIWALKKLLTTIVAPNT
jgi:hypothetical protein